MKKFFLLCLKSGSGLAVFVLLFYFCKDQTGGFRPYFILSNLPNDSRWETPPLSDTEKATIFPLLKQKFTFLGGGGWCFAFLGEDQRTVLKFYKHTHLHPLNFWKELSWKKLLLHAPPWTPSQPYFQEFNFNSCMLMYKHAQELTGLLYVHLNKTEGLHGTVDLIDKIGIHHVIDLDHTEFIVQQRAELLLPHLEKLMAEDRVEEAKYCIDSLFSCLLSLYKKGIRDFDRSIRKNYGFINGRAVAFDISSFGSDPTLKDPKKHQEELCIKTHRIARWLRKHYPVLYTYYETCLANVSS